MTPELHSLMTAWLKSGDEHQKRHARHRLAMPDAIGYKPEMGAVAPADYPSLLQQAGNAAQAAGRVIKAAVTGGAVAVDRAETDRRLAVCMACPHFDPGPGKCRLCGCVGRWKTRLATEHCPDVPPRW